MPSIASKIRSLWDGAPPDRAVFLLYHKIKAFASIRAGCAVSRRIFIRFDCSYKNKKSFIDFRAGIEENKERRARFFAPRNRIFSSGWRTKP